MAVFVVIDKTHNVEQCNSEGAVWSGVWSRTCDALQWILLLYPEQPILEVLDVVLEETPGVGVPVPAEREVPVSRSEREVNMSSTAMESHARKVRSLAKNVLGSTRVRTTTCVAVSSTQYSDGFLIFGWFCGVNGMLVVI